MATRRAVLAGFLLLGTVALAQPAPPPNPVLQAPDEKAQCLKQCTGSPRDATGPSLLACLRRCEGPASAPGATTPDGGR